MVHTWVEASRQGNVLEHLSAIAKEVSSGSSSEGSFFASEPRRAGIVLDALVDVLNSSSSSSNEKVRVLATLCDIARDSALRDLLFDAVRRLDTAFEEIMLAREDGRSNFNVGIGEFHSLMVVLLTRLMDYKLTGSHLLEMVRDNTKLASDLVSSVVKVRAPALALALALAPAGADAF